MSLLTVVAISGVVLVVAYFTYGRFLSRYFMLDSRQPTPAVELRDDIDYVPIEPKFLLSQHFSAIAAAGPIVGPILAGVMFGWLPALLWILIGAVLIGGVHDMAALVASIRHKARSIAEVVRDHMSRRSYVLFLVFIWIALVYIIVAFTDITAASFVGVQTLENGEHVSGGGIATSSLLYLALPVAMGLLLRYTRLTVGWATVIFLPLVGVAIWAGQKLPLDLAALLQIPDAQAHKVWDVLLLGYCVVAAIVPVWMLLQPRGHLGGYFLYVALAAGCIGVVFGGHAIQYPAFTNWTITPPGGVSKSLAPFLFITIACGACSGFHALIASGTTSKQLRVETDARPIGYGAMLLEAMVAVISLCCVMILAPGATALSSGPNFIYASGVGNFLGVLQVPHALAVSFALMAFTTFVYDTLDVCTRLGRYIIQELTGLSGWQGRWLGTLLTAGAPLYFVLNKVTINGQEQPVWRMFWELFGASNQLLAALTLLGITVWLWRTRRNPLVWLITGVPTVLMYTMSTWALVSLTLPRFYNSATGRLSMPTDPVPWVGVVLIALAALMLIEAFRAILGPQPPPTSFKPAMAST
jgi:carbon starvation protein